MKRITSIILIAVLCIGMLPTMNVLAKKHIPKVVFSECYNEYYTNSKPTVGTISGKNVRVVERTANKDKALYLELKDGNASIEYTFDTDSKYLGLSMDIMLSGDKPKLKLLLANQKGGWTTLYKTGDNGGGYTYDNYGISGVSSNCYTNLSLIYNSKRKCFYILIDGKLQVKNWEIPKTAALDCPKGVKIELENNGENVSGMYLDNVFAYESADYVCADNFLKTGFNVNEIEFVPDIEEAVKSNIYLSESFENNKTSLTLYPKDNICEMRYDEVEQNSYLHVERRGTSDNYFVSNISAQSNRIIIEMDVKYNDIPYNIQISAKDASQSSFSMVKINSGKVYTAVDSSLIASLSKAQWVNIQIALNCSSGKFDFYLDGELIRKGISVSGNATGGFSSLTCYANSGSGSADISFDNLRIYDGKAPREDLDFDSAGNMPKINYSGTVETQYVKNCIVYSIHSDNVYYGAAKHKLKNKIYDADNIFTVSAEDIMQTLGINIQYNEETKDILIGEKTLMKLGEKTVSLNGKDVAVQVAPYFENGVLYLGVDDVYKTILKRDIYYDERGFCVIGTPKATYSSEESAKISNYMIYDHPSKQKLLELFDERKPQHPRIIANRERFEFIKANWKEDKILSIWGNNVIRFAETYAKAKPVEYVLTNGKLLTVSRNVYEKAKSLSMAYWLMGETKYVDALWKNIEAAMSFPDWNPPHPLDVAEMSMAFAIAYDWCYDAWTDEQKSLMEKAMLEKGINVMSTGAYASKLWAHVTGENNRTIVNNGGVAAAAMAIFEAEPDTCADFISNSAWGMDNALNLLYPVGEWLEGSGYWMYAMDYFANYLSSVVNVFGTDFGMLNAIGLDKTAETSVYSTGAGLSDNYHDTGRGTSTISAECNYWLANVFKDLNMTNIMLSKTVKTGMARALLWLDTDVEADSYSGELDKTFEGPNQYFSMRSSLVDDSALILMGHAGVGTAPHGHLDTGTFVLDAMGERWAEDIGSDPYTYANVITVPEQYHYYRLAPQGHNCIVINPKKDKFGMVPDSYCPRESFLSKERGAYVTVDMSSAYAEDANSAKRGYMLTDDRHSAIVRDEVDLKGESTVYWMCQTMADIEVADNNTVILSKNGKKLKVNFISNAKSIEVTAEAARPLEGTNDYEGQEKNDKYKKIQVKLNANGNFYIQAKFTPVGDYYENAPNPDIAIADWTIPDGEVERMPELTGILVNGQPLLDEFSPTKVGYKYFLENEGENPVVTATAEKGVKVIIDKVDENTVNITAVSLRGNLTRTYVVRFVYVPGIGNYKRLPVKTIEVSDEPELDNPGINAMDNDLNTRWTSIGKNQWIMLDLGKIETIDGVCVAVFKGGERLYNFDIQVSDDNDTWTTVREKATNSGEGDNMELFEFQPVKARYVRLICNENNKNKYNNIVEFGALKK